MELYRQTLRGKWALRPFGARNPMKLCYRIVMVNAPPSYRTLLNLRARPESP